MRLAAATVCSFVATCSQKKLPISKQLSLPVITRQPFRLSTTKMRTDALFSYSSSSSNPSPQPPPANDGNSNKKDDNGDKNPNDNNTQKNDNASPITTMSTSNNNDILSHDLHHLSHLIQTKQITCHELMTATLQRISQLNPTYNAIVSLRDTESLLSTARSYDESLTTTTSAAPSDVGPLFGIPLAIKDMIDVSSLPTTKGSPLLSQSPPPTTDDIIVSRLKQSGAIIIGKTNVPEFGLGSHTFNPVFGTTVNSFNVKKSGGGSSGGAAVAIATGMVSGGDGSDMMGSLRNPAGWNNLYSWRPTVRERVEVGDGGGRSFGSLSTAGPIGRCPCDLELMGGIMMGMETTAKMSQRPDLKGLTIGWLGDWGGDYPMEDGVLQLCREALGTFENLGCHVVIADDGDDDGDNARPSLFPSGRLWESWTTLRSYHLAKELPHGFSAIKPEATWEIRRGLSLSKNDVTRAIDMADEWSRYCEDVLFGKYDVLALPSSQVFAFPRHERYPKMIAGRFMDTYHRWMEVMIPVSLAGLPCVTVPVGFSDDGLSMGMQLFSRRGWDQLVLEVAQGYHLEMNWVRERQPACLLGLIN